MVLTELILTVSTFGQSGVLKVFLKELIFTVSTVGGCDGLEVTNFFTVSTSGHSGAFVRPDFEQLIP